MRFLLTIRNAVVTAGQGLLWTIEIQGGGKSWQRHMIQNADGAGGLIPSPSPTPLAPTEVPLTGLAAQRAEDVLKVYNEIVARTPDHITEYGKYLFDNLLGKVIWDEIMQLASAQNDPLIELALSWPHPNDDETRLNVANLSRLHWEMMFDGDHFLGAGHLPPGKKFTDVAITRVISSTTATAGPIGELPRVLFIIGTSLSNPTIRSGAEVMGLLRDAQTGCRISPRVIENATPKAVQNKVSEFHPEVVHFICHGELDALTKAGFIEVQADAGEDKTQFFADSIWQWLNVAGSPPQIVILSSCQSGTAWNGASMTGEPLAPHSVAPLAAELVCQGIPVVIAMSGRVSDQACRLFTRTFAKALVSGESLVRATAKGRRAAIAGGDAPKRSVDWGFPTLYLSSMVKEDYAPSAGNATFGDDLETRIQPYALRVRERQPVFCGRQKFFDAYHELFENSSRGAVLVAYNYLRQTDRDTAGYGRTRLLEELTIQCIRDGHVPCAVIVTDDKGWTPPKTELDLAMSINTAMEAARSSLGLETKDIGPIELLKSYYYKRKKYGDLPKEVRDGLAQDDDGSGDMDGMRVGAHAIVAAIELQFTQLMAQARSEVPHLIGTKSRAVLLLDEVHRYGVLLDSLTKEPRFGVWGFGKREQPVPVIMAFSLNTAADELLKPIVDPPRTNWNAIELTPFNTSPEQLEDILVYGRVLLNPFTKVAPTISDQAWFLDYGVGKDKVDDSLATFRMFMTGKPSELLEKAFYAAVKYGTAVEFVKPAGDEQKLRELLQERK